MIQIAFVAYEGLTALDLVGPLEVLTRIPDTQVELVATRPGPATTDTGALQLTAPRHVREVPTPDVIVVPGGAAGTWQAMTDTDLMSWLQQAAREARWIASVCNGAHILGAAGLLTGRRATTHWAVHQQLQTHGATPVNDRIVVDGNVVTAAGVSAGIDMGLWLAGELAGREQARLIQLLIEYDPQPPFDAGSPDKAGQALTRLARGTLRRTLEQGLAGGNETPPA